MTEITHAMIMAAGLGTRMRHLTENCPKPLVKVCGHSLLDRALERVAEAGVGTAVVNVHYLADQITSHLEPRKVPNIVISDETDELLETGGGVTKALPALGALPFFTLNTDAMWLEGVSPTLASMAAAFDSEKMDALLLLAPAVASIGFSGAGDFFMEDDGLLVRRGEARVAPFVFAGVTISHPRLFADAPEGPFSTNVLWDRAIEAGRLFGFRHEGVWMHVGTPEAVDEAEALIGT